MELFDTHFHLPKEGDLSGYLDALPAEHRFRLLALGNTLATSRRALEFAERSPRVWCAAGVHPEDLAEFDGDLSPFRELYAHPKVRAVGEIGLDFFYDFTSHAEQIKVFEQFLEVALEVQLPVSVHCRDAEERSDAYVECYAMLRDFAADAGENTMILHCYAGTPHYLEKFLELGAFIGVTGMITFKKADNIRDNLRHVPADRLLLETDSPYLAPAPHRGKVNHPAFLPAIAQKVAEVYGTATENIAAQCTRNGMKIFRIAPEEE